MCLGKKAEPCKRKKEVQPFNNNVLVHLKNAPEANVVAHQMCLKATWTNRVILFPTDLNI